MGSSSPEAAQAKAKLKLDVNLWLLAIAFTLFTFIIAVNPELVRKNVYLSLQLTLSIPLIISSIFARMRLSHYGKTALWDRYGFVTFILAYGCMVNVIGILLSTLVGTGIAMVFWGVNILLALLYAAFELLEDRKDNVFGRLAKDLIFIVVIVTLGILPVLGVY